MKFLQSYYKSLLWVTVILILLFSPGNRLPHPKFFNIPHFDKIVHCILFFTLAYIIFFDTYVLKKAVSLKNFFAIASMCIIFGGLTEIGQQYLTINRTANIYDFIADVVGIILGLTVFRLFGKTINRLYRPIF